MQPGWKQWWADTVPKRFLSFFSVISFDIALQYHYHSSAAMETPKAWASPEIGVCHGIGYKFNVNLTFAILRSHSGGSSHLPLAVLIRSEWILFHRI